MTDRAPGEDTPTLFAQISELYREARVRGYVYPGLIARHKLTQAQADLQNRCLNEAIANLERLKAETGRP